MTVRLRAMTGDELGEWSADRPDAVPGGAPARGHEVFAVEDDGARVGFVWFGPDPHRDDDPSAAWLYDLQIGTGRRGLGHGRQAVQLLEALLAERGVRELGLEIAGDNVSARHLSSRAGFRETRVTMSKRLRTGRG